ncbi:MAG TPA: MlaD family protein [Steroidobacteraceae bacterium]|nr:MlaD family protein [Steroidobacteraceae bacterium]
MEREANYAAVGAFVLLVIAMAGLFVYWYTDAREHRDFTRYEVYFYGSVSGLTRGAPVRYLGVDVGRVVSMYIDHRNAARVQVIVDIDSTTPVSEESVAELSQQGLTGVLFIDLLRDAGSRRLVEGVPSERYPVIRSTKSNFDLLLASLPEMVGRASDVLGRFQLLLDADNIRSITHAFANLDATTQSLPDTIKELRALIANLHATSDEFRVTAASVRGVTDAAGPQLHDVLERVTAVTEHLSSATENLDQLIRENRGDVRAFTRESLPQVELLLGDSRAAVAEVRDLARSLHENPSQLLFEKPDQGVTIPP